MTWFKEHINLTWVLFTLLQFVGIAFESVIPFVVLRIIWIIATFWALNEKGRSWAWFFIPISVLLLANKRKVNVSQSQLEEQGNG